MRRGHHFEQSLIDYQEPFVTVLENSLRLAAFYQITTLALLASRPNENFNLIVFPHSDPIPFILLANAPLMKQPEVKKSLLRHASSHPMPKNRNSPFRISVLII